MTIAKMPSGYRLMQREDLIPTVVDGLTATASGTQATSQLITASVSRFTTVTTTADGATLPAAPALLERFTIINAGANSMNVFPAVGDAINALSANAAYALAAGKTVQFVAAGPLHFHTFPA